MDQHLDHLLGLAEITITLVGFSALISVVGSARAVSHAAVDRFRIWILIVSGLYTIAALLMPVILAKFLAEDFVWRTSSAAFLVIDVAYLTWGMGQQNRLAPVLTRMDVWVTRSVLVITVPVYLALFNVVFNIVDGFAASGFFFAMYLQIVILGVFFMSIATSVLWPGIAEGQKNPGQE